MHPGQATAIPFHQFGQQGAPLHFAHANGYPPLAYRQLLGGLADTYRVTAMRMRALWPGADPSSLHDWSPLADDLQRFLLQEGLQGLAGAGHSMGATTTLRLALRSPQAFRALVLIDPVLFTPTTIVLMRTVHALGLTYRLHPLVKPALNRRRTFESKSAMYANYRQKTVFRHMDEAALQDYVDALARPRPDGTLELEYSPEWEARIYVTGVLADMQLWRAMSELQLPLLVIRGQLSDTFRPEALRLLQKRLPSARLETVPDATHLVPLERPALVCQLIRDFLEEIL